MALLNRQSLPQTSTITILTLECFELISRHSLQWQSSLCSSPLAKPVINNNKSPIDATEFPAPVSVMVKIETVKYSASNESRTATLWIQDLNQIMLMHDFIRVIKSEDYFASCLEYELAPKSLSLFDYIFLRKTQKCVMYDVIESVVGSQQIYPAESTVVVAGWYLPRRVMWPQDVWVSDIYSAYVTQNVLIKCFPSAVFSSVCQKHLALCSLYMQWLVETPNLPCTDRVRRNRIYRIVWWMY